MKTKQCAFTGHRPQSLPFGFNEADERCIALKQKLRDEIIRQIEENGVTHFITGMAIGVDMFAAEIVLGLKSAYMALRLSAPSLVKRKLRNGARRSGIGTMI